MAKRPPNIFVFMSDQERADVVRPDHPCRTPVADKVAAEGLRFENCYTPTAHSCPSRATYFTGLYPSQHGIFNNILTHTAIDGRIKAGRMFSENMREAGWNLGHTGKWHCSNTEEPHDRGWEEVLSTALASNKMSTETFWNNALRRAKADDPAPRQRGEIIQPGYGRKRLYGAIDKSIEDFHDYQVVVKAIEAMERYTKEDKPFFIHCGPLAPHDPYLIPEKYAKMYDPSQVQLPPNFYDDLQDKPRIYQRQNKQIWSQLSEDEHREAIAHYWGYCSMVDDLRAMICDAIDSLGIRDNTMLIFTSDHGDYLASHGLYCKGVPAFDEGVRIPMIMRWPEGIENPGRVIEPFVTLSDFAPTFLEVAGLEQNPTSGQSFAPFFKSSETPAGWPDEVHTQFSGVELYYTQRSVRTWKHKYVFNGFDFDELYDLEKDPHELKNLIDDPAYGAIKQDLVKRLWAFSAREKDVTGNPYFTVALLPWGPNIALTEMAEKA